MPDGQQNYGKGRKSVVHIPKQGNASVLNQSGKRRRGIRKTNGQYIER